MRWEIDLEGSIHKLEKVKEKGARQKEKNKIIIKEHFPHL